MINRSQRRISSRPHDVYKAYDTSGALLYVGISVNVFTRLREHKYYARWYRAAHRIEVTQYTNRLAARIEEARCIDEDSPMFNVTKERVSEPGVGDVLEEFTMYQDWQGWYIL